MTRRRVLSSSDPAVPSLAPIGLFARAATTGCSLLGGFDQTGRRVRAPSGHGNGSARRTSLVPLGWARRGSLADAGRRCLRRVTDRSSRRPGALLVGALL